MSTIQIIADDRPTVTVGELVQQYNDGTTATDLAEKYGVCAATILKHLHDAGVPVRKGRRGQHTIAESFEWLDRHLSGESLQKIANENGITRERARQVCASAALCRLRMQRIENQAAE